MPCLVAGMGRTQTSATCDSTRSLGTRQSSTILCTSTVWENEREKEAGWLRGWGEKQIKRDEGGKEQTDMNALLAT